MEVWGITGLAGSGKSTAIEYLRSKGYPTADADQFSRLVVDRNTEAGKEGFEKIFRSFGPSVLDSLGNLDKKALMKRILTSPADKEKLEAIVNPLTLNYFSKVMKEWKAQEPALAFVEGPRLVETGFHKVVAGIVQVTADLDKRITRVAKRDTMGKLEVEMLFRMQDEELMRRMRKVEWKNSTNKLKDLYTQIDAFIAERLAKKA